MATIAVPSSKSLSHRHIMCAALAAGESIIHNVLESKDIERTIAVLKGAGADIQSLGNQSYRIIGVNGLLKGGLSKEQALPCDMHESGTSCRLLTAILATGKGYFRIFGASRLHERPIGQLTTALQSLGININYEKSNNCPPFLLETHGLEGGDVSIPLDESSQYLSALLMAAPLAKKGLCISISGKKALSWPYVALTLQTLQKFGIVFEVQVKNSQWQSIDWQNIDFVQPQSIRFIVHASSYLSNIYTVEGDWSSASYFLAAGLIGKSPLHIKGLDINSMQADKYLLTILKQMGAKLDINADCITVYPSSLHGIDVDMGQCPDLVPTVAVLSAFASGTTNIHNVAHLRIKESDRIAAPAKELRKIGLTIEEHSDGLSITGQNKHYPKSMLFSSHGDHRMAMSLSLLTFANINVQLDDPKVVEKSFPNFWQLWEKIVE